MNPTGASEQPDSRSYEFMPSHWYFSLTSSNCFSGSQFENFGVGLDNVFARPFQKGGGGGMPYSGIFSTPLVLGLRVKARKSLKNQCRTLFLLRLNGGARRDRTDDLNTASVALSQLSYGPTEPSENLREAHASNIAVLCQLNRENSFNPEVSVML